MGGGSGKLWWQLQRFSTDEAFQSLAFELEPLEEFTHQRYSPIGLMPRKSERPGLAIT